MGKLVFTVKGTLYLPDVDFIGWVQLSYILYFRSFHGHLIFVTVRPSSSEIHIASNVRPPKQVVFKSKCIKISQKIENDSINSIFST